MSLRALRAELGLHGGALAELALAQSPRPEPAGPELARPGRADPEHASGPAPRAAAGPRVSRHAAEYELLLEMILEGTRLHYGSPQVVLTDDSDLALLLGDQLYALGLARLAALADLESIAELADVISLTAQAHAAADPDLADAVWEAGATAIGWGSTTDHEFAKGLARAGDRGAAGALRAAARARDGRDS